MQHLLVRKLTRRELEDKYLRLIDENYDLKRENNVQKEKIKVITTKLLRLNKENSKYKSRDFLFMDENNEIQEAEEFYSPSRPRASSARLCKDVMRNSTPNLNPRKRNVIIQFIFQIKMEQQPTSNRLSEMEEEIQHLNQEIENLQQVGELEKKTNFQLEQEVKLLKEKLSNTEIEKELEQNVEVIALNRKIKDLQKELDDIANVNVKKLIESKSEQEKLSELLEKERQNIKKYEAQSHDLIAAKKMVEDLMDRAAVVEKEKADLRSQFEKYASISEEVKSCKKKMTELTQKLDSKEKELNKTKTDNESIAHSQEDLLKKMKDLQKENDNLVVKLEGLKTENDGLINKNKKLEDRVKVLEDQNKQQLIKLNETLKLPVPAPKDQEALKQRVEQDVRKIEKIRETALSASNDVSEKNESKTGNSSQIESSLNLTKGSSIDKSEMSRDHSLDFKSPSSEKKFNIPQIIEPTSRPSKILTINDEHAKSDLLSVSRERQFDNASTINSQDLPTISRDSQASSSSKAFQITFSKSGKYLFNFHLLIINNFFLLVSKDESVDDEEIDQNTFSVDQDKFCRRHTCDLTRSISILKKTEMPFRNSTSDVAIERARNLLVNQVMNQDDNSGQLKRLKNSIESIMKDENKGWSNLVISKRESKTNKKVKELVDEKYREHLIDHPSLSNTRKTLSQLPRYVLDNIQNDDPNFTVKYGINYVSIEIVSLQLTANTNFICDDSIQKLYVEYSFLGYKGHLLETPQSLFKPKKENELMYYRFHKKFELKSDENEKQLKLLKAMLEKNTKKHLRFLIVSEPIDENDECEEVGFSTVNLSEVVKKSKIDSEKLSVNVYSTSYPHELIALLTVTFEGILFMKELLRDM
ncbi:unnamed protein product [Diamesa hyperborea]